MFNEKVDSVETLMKATENGRKHLHEFTALLKRLQESDLNKLKGGVFKREK